MSSTTDMQEWDDAALREEREAMASIEERDPYLHPTMPGTLALLSACALTYIVVSGDSPSGNARLASFIMLAGIGVSTLCDARVSLRNLVRVDLLGILALYFLTLFEFLFPQPDFDAMTNGLETVEGIRIVLVGFVGLTIGRHLIRPDKESLGFVQTFELSSNMYFKVLVIAFFLSVFYMLLAVNFNPLAWIDALMGPRFSQPWSRGRWGGWRDLLNELGLLGFIVPPLTGVIFAKRKDFTGPQLTITAILFLLHFFIGVCSGTRNVMAVNLASLVGGYFIVQSQLRLRPLIIAGLVTGVVFLFLSHHMLRFRAMGLERYLKYDVFSSQPAAAMDVKVGGPADFNEGKGFFVDYNLATIISLQHVFPEQHGFIGWNLPWVALTKPIPRAIWKGKPEGLAVSIEDLVGVQGMTLASTFVGESYVAGGMLGVLTAGLFLGAFCAWWNRLGGMTNTNFSRLVYAIGLLAILITMRSLMFFTTLLLPSLALMAYAWFFRGQNVASE